MCGASFLLNCYRQIASLPIIDTAFQRISFREAILTQFLCRRHAGGAERAINKDRTGLVLAQLADLLVEFGQRQVQGVEQMTTLEISGGADIHDQGVSVIDQANRLGRPQTLATRQVAVDLVDDQRQQHCAQQGKQDGVTAQKVKILFHIPFWLKTRVNIRYHYRMIRSVLLAVALLALPAYAQDSGDDTGDSDPRIQESNSDLKKVQTRIEALSQRVDSERGKQDDLREELESTEKQISDTADHIKNIGGLISAQQRKIRASQEDQARAQSRLAEQKKALAQQIRAAYLIGERGQLRLLLNQDNAQKMDRVSAYYDYLNRARANYAESIRSQLDKIAAIQDKAAQQNGELLKLKDKQQKSLAALEAKRSSRGQTIREINERINNDLGEMKQLKANERSIQNLLQSLHDTLSDIPLDVIRDAKPFPKMKGKLPWPIRGKLLASFGDAKAGGHLSWNGYWIDAPTGAPVRAVANGRVAYVGWMQRYGLIIIIEHEGGYFSLYGHNDSVELAGGETVRIGQTIAKAGSTGGYEQSGVYFEIRKGTQPINPKLWLSK